MADEVDYDKLAALLTDSHVPLGKPTVMLTADAAAAAGRAFLLQEYGSEDALRKALGPHADALDDPAG